MKAFKIRENIFAVGVKDWNLKEFHGYLTPRGSSYNSYLIIDDKITLIDGVKSCLSEENIARIQSVVDLSKIHYIIANHIEQDHSGNIPELMKLAPQAVIITNAMGKAALEAHFDTTGWQYEIIKTGDIINIGKRNLSFITTPMLHWPDSQMTYIPEEKILFSNDGFGQHFCADTLYAKDQNFGVVCEEAKKYYANILFPFGAQADKVLNQAHDLNLDIEMIAPAHGVIWDGKKEVETVLSLYKDWSEGKNKGKAVVIYDTMWGATAKMANAVMEEFQDNGIPVTKRCLDITHYSSVIVDLVDAEYVIIGNPTLNQQLFPRVSQFLTYMRGLRPKNKKAFAFGSYGWRPGVVDEIENIFKELGWQTVEPYQEKYTPQKSDLENLRQKVRDLIKTK